MQPPPHSLTGRDGEPLPNTEQADAWNGDEGRHWVEHRERYDQIMQRFTPHLLKATGLAPGQRVLDVGCGSGETTCLAARVTRDGLALGVDLSSPLLDAARRRADHEGLANAHFQQGDVEVHPLAAAEYDVAMSRFGVMFFKAPTAAFVNIARAVRPGGRLVFLCWQDAARNEWFTKSRAALAGPGDQPEMSGDEPGPFSLADPRQIREHLDGTGFLGVSITSVTEPMRLGSDVEDVIDFVRDRGWVRERLAGADEITAKKALDSVRAALQPHQSADGVLLEGAAWLVTAHRA